MINAIGRELPDAVDGYGPLVPFGGAFATLPGIRRHAPLVRAARPGDQKLVGSLEEVFKRIPIRDGMTISFHHHLRNGDGVLNIDVLVTDHGVAVNPRRTDLTNQLAAAGLPVRDMTDLKAIAAAGDRSRPLTARSRIVAVVE